MAEQADHPVEIGLGDRAFVQKKNKPAGVIDTGGKGHGGSPQMFERVTLIASPASVLHQKSGRNKGDVK